MAEEKSETQNKSENISVSNNSSDTITIKKETMWKYSTFILAGILIVWIVLTFTGGDKTLTPTGQVINEPQQQVPSEPDKANVNIENYPSKGKSNAPVTIVEYSDYECPFCGRFYSQTLPLIQREYVDSGKVKLVFKDFPLGFHQYAQKAAEAAHCVKEQKGDDGYWKMHDKLFENQQSLSIENIKQWAKELGVNVRDFNSCLDSGKMATTVQKAMREGQQDGVQGTPAFFINGKLLSGAQPFENFRQIIEAELQ